MACHVFLSVICIVSLVRCQTVECNTDSECNCPLSSSGATCTLSCTETEICKAKTLNCRQGDPCNIECKSSAACSDGTTINAQNATNVIILCQGHDACNVNIDILCGTGDCTLLCNGETSCVDWGFIDVSLSSSFQCIGDCPSTFTASITSTQIPTHITTNTNGTAAIHTLHSTLSDTHYPPSHAPTSQPFSNTMLKDDDGTVLFRPSTHYAQSPLLYAASTFILITFCVCCMFCMWVYSKEEQQKRIERKSNNPDANNAAEHIQIRPLHDESRIFKESLESSDLYEYDDDDGGDREGPLPTHLKIQTVDMISHRAVMHPNSNINVNMAKCQIPKIEVANNALPNLPPPRSLPYPHSPCSSPPQTPIPNDVNHIIHIPQLTEFEPGIYHHYIHRQYASLPTVPSLPSITNCNDPIEPSVSSVTMRVSMVSCMVLEEDSHQFDELEAEADEMESESAEYQSHRRGTYESYDYLNRSPFSKQFSVGHVTKQISSTIKLHDIREARRDDEELEISASKSFESVSETSVSKNSPDDKTGIVMQDSSHMVNNKPVEL